VPEKQDEQDDGNWYPKEPEQYSTTHLIDLLTRADGMPTSHSQWRPGKNVPQGGGSSTVMPSKPAVHPLPAWATGSSAEDQNFPILRR
jgi:hypothetical protein